jgi:hypothetical protein
VQIATLLYNDRVNTYRELKVLDVELDIKPTFKKVADMAELRIRNLQCFKELQFFNDTGAWANCHPLLVHYSEHFRLEKLRKTNPEGFLKEYANCTGNIKRYRSYLNSNSRSDQRDSDKKNLRKHEERRVIFENILKNE